MATNPEMPPTGTEVQLKALMAAAGIASWRELAERSGLSVEQLRRLRRQGLAPARLQTLDHLAGGLGVPLSSLLGQREELAANGELALRQECDRLQQQLAQQEHTLREAFERDSLAQLESWLLNWPRALLALERNPSLPASKLVPLVQPIWKLLEQWQWQAIGRIGETIPFDPQRHTPCHGSPDPQQPVRVRCPGAQWRDRLLRRAEVEVLPEETSAR